jgi:hypothetical protein
MENNIDYIISDTFEKFIHNFNDYVFEMLNCEHGFSYIPHQYHLEGNVWTHTCMSYSHIKSVLENVKLDEHEIVLLCIIVLFHDIGKPTCYQDDIEKKKRTFNQHDYRSMQIMLNNYKIIKSVFSVSDEDIIGMMLIIQSHTLYYQVNDINKVYALLNYRHDLIKLYTLLASVDARGQIRSNSSRSGKDDVDLLKEFLKLDFNNIKKVDDKPSYKRNLYIISGCSGSGKDFVCKNHLSKKIDIVVSWDDIRVSLYLDNNENDINETYNELYHKAFAWCSEQKNINLLQETQQLVTKLYKNGYNNIAIANVSLTRKARKSLIGIGKTNNANVHSVALLVEKDKLVNRNMLRVSEVKGKKIEKEIIYNMFDQYILPTHIEGFKSIKYIFN